MNDTPLDQRRAYTKKDAAKVLSVSAATINRLVDDGSLPIVRLGGVQRIAAADIDRLLKGQGTQAPAQGYDAADM